MGNVHYGQLTHPVPYVADVVCVCVCMCVCVLCIVCACACVCVYLHAYIGVYVHNVCMYVLCMYMYVRTLCCSTDRIVFSILLLGLAQLLDFGACDLRASTTILKIWPIELSASKTYQNPWHQAIKMLCVTTLALLLMEVPFIKTLC